MEICKFICWEQLRVNVSLDRYLMETTTDTIKAGEKI